MPLGLSFVASITFQVTQFIQPSLVVSVLSLTCCNCVFRQYKQGTLILIIRFTPTPMSYYEVTRNKRVKSSRSRFDGALETITSSSPAANELLRTNPSSYAIVQQVRPLWQTSGFFGCRRLRLMRSLVNNAYPTERILYCSIVVSDII